MPHGIVKSMKVRIRHNLNQIPVILDQVQQRAARQATSRSMKRAIKAAMVESVQGVRASQAVKLTASELKKGSGKRPYFFTREQVDSSTPLGEMRAELKASDYKISLFRFFAKKKLVKRMKSPFGLQQHGKRAGKALKLYGAQVKVMGRTYLAGSGFIVDKNGAKIIMKRSTSARLPLEKLWGPSMFKILQGTGVQEKAQARALSVFRTNFNNDFRFYLNKIRVNKALREAKR
jgi:hypothetical protein